MSTPLSAVAVTRPEPVAASRPAPASARRELLLVAAVTLLALALRLTGLGHESLWYDEAATMQLVRQPAVALLTGAPAARDNGNPAGYFVLLRFWLLLGGFTVENARALSAVAGALGVPAVWLLARACRLPRPAGLLAALLVAVSPPLVYLGQEARVFALFATVATLAAACVAVIEQWSTASGGRQPPDAAKDQGADAPRSPDSGRDAVWWAWIGFAALGALMVHLHYYAAFVLAALGLHLAVWGWRHDRRALWKLALSALVVVLAFAPWLGVFRWQLRQGAARSSESWLQHLALMPLFDLGGRTLVWKEFGLPAVIAADLAAAVLVFAPAAWLLRRCRPFPWLPLAFAAGVPVFAALVSLKAPMVHSHYLSVIIPAVLLLLACALVAGWRQGARRLVVGAGLALAVVTAASLGRLYAEPHKDDWRGLAARVARDGGAAPAYFYEDIGADCFSYYDPGRPAVRLTEPFDGGAGWDRSGDAARMRGETDGFWLVLYLPEGAFRSDEDPVVDWLHHTFRVEADERFGRMRLLRCRPAP